LYISVFAKSDERVGDKCNEDCKKPCTFTSYDVQVSYAEYPSKFVSDLEKYFVPGKDNQSYVRYV